jgi:hypothetical protein
VTKTNRTTITHKNNKHSIKTHCKYKTHCKKQFVVKTMKTSQKQANKTMKKQQQQTHFELYRRLSREVGERNPQQKN